MSIAIFVIDISCNLIDISIMHLYIIEIKPNGPIKVGIADALSERLNSLQHLHYNKLHIFKSWELSYSNAYYLEGIAHHLLEEWQIKGEWFRCSALKAEKIIKVIFKKTNNLSDWSVYSNIVSKIIIGNPGANASLKARAVRSKGKAEIIKDRWIISPKKYPTADLLKEAGVSLNTAKAYLGKRPIAQYNYQAKMKRKANAKR